MQDFAGRLPADWPEILATGDKDRIRELLPVLEACLKELAGLEGVFLALLAREDFWLSARAFIALSRINDPAMWQPLIAYIEETEATHWRLCALEVLAGLPVFDRCQDLKGFLADPDHIFVRGVIVLLGQKGPAALPLLAEFASSERAGAIKDEILVDAVWRSAGSRSELLEPLFSERPGFKRFWQYQTLPELKENKYPIFPYPDYLWQKARTAGIKQGDYKRLHYRARSKKSPS